MILPVCASLENLHANPRAASVQEVDLDDGGQEHNRCLG